VAGLSPKLPVRRDKVNGFALNTTYQQVVQQNLKNLVLTSPGERMMDPEFGVGIRSFLFEQNYIGLRNDIEDRIRTQVDIYMPFVTIEQVIFSEDEASVDSNRINVSIEYSVDALAIFDLLDISVSLS
jgi:hypothetical protein